jgi:hypothetical protein
VLDNDADGDWDTLTAVLDAGVGDGLLTLDSDGSFDYQPDENFCGADNFAYHAQDESDSSNTVTVTLSVTCLNDDPLADDDTFIADEDSSANTLDVLAGDSDVDGDTLTISAVGSPDQGGSIVNNGGSLSYTPAADFNGSEVFTYTASDGNGGFDTALVTVTVTALNDVPLADDDAFGVDEDTANTLVLVEIVTWMMPHHLRRQPQPGGLVVCCRD